jgi:2-polyprenyl-3-methyl-5-hydroxy-6-metoxy-1,4-benzoquinol methylase
MFSTTEITSNQIVSDNPVHQRLFFAYVEAGKHLSGKVLEVGCGVGRGLDILIENCTEFTAIDKNEQLIQFLQTKYPQQHFITQNIPPFKDLPSNTYDFVVSFQVIEHIQDDNAYLQEIHRVLKPGGKAMITTPNIKLSLTRNPWHVREYTAEQLEKLFRKYFQQVDTKGVAGNEKVMDYYEQNKKAVRKITHWDIFNLQYLLPRQILRIPYDILNRMNRKNLHKQNNTLVSDIEFEDYFLSDKPAESLDLFYIATK